LSEIASEYGIHPEQARRWINQFIASAHSEKYYHLRYQKVLHSDRGTQFTSRRFRVYLEELRLRSDFKKTKSGIGI
jgi:transposase-like protein